MKDLDPPVTCSLEVRWILLQVFWRISQNRTFWFSLPLPATLDCLDCRYCVCFISVDEHNNCSWCGRPSVERGSRPIAPYCIISQHFFLIFNSAPKAETVTFLPLVLLLTRLSIQRFSSPLASLDHKSSCFSKCIPGVCPSLCLSLGYLWSLYTRLSRCDTASLTRQIGPLYGWNFNVIYCGRQFPSLNIMYDLHWEEEESFISKNLSFRRGIHDDACSHLRSIFLAFKHR